MPTTSRFTLVDAPAVARGRFTTPLQHARSVAESVRTGVLDEAGVKLPPVVSEAEISAETVTPTPAAEPVGAVPVTPVAKPVAAATPVPTPKPTLSPSYDDIVDGFKLKYPKQYDRITKMAERSEPLHLIEAVAKGNEPTPKPASAKPAVAMPKLTPVTALPSSTATRTDTAPEPLVEQDETPPVRPTRPDSGAPVRPWPPQPVAPGEKVSAPGWITGPDRPLVQKLEHAISGYALANPNKMEGFKDIAEKGMTSAVVAGLMVAPVPTAIALAKFMGVAEVENLGVALLTKQQPHIGEGKGLKELAPDTLHPVWQVALDGVDFIGQAALAGKKWGLKPQGWETFQNLTNRERGLVVLDAAQKTEAGMPETTAVQDAMAKVAPEVVPEAKPETVPETPPDAAPPVAEAPKPPEVAEAPPVTRPVETPEATPIVELPKPEAGVVPTAETAPEAPPSTEPPQGIPPTRWKQAQETATIRVAEIESEWATKNYSGPTQEQQSRIDQAIVDTAAEFGVPTSTLRDQVLWRVKETPEMARRGEKAVMFGKEKSTAEAKTEPVAEPTPEATPTPEGRVEPLRYDPSTNHYSGKPLVRGDVLTDLEGNRYSVDRANGFMVSVDTLDASGNRKAGPAFSVDPSDKPRYKDLVRTGENVFEEKPPVAPPEAAPPVAEAPPPLAPALSRESASALLSLPHTEQVSPTGPQYAKLRQRVVSELVGENVPLGKSGATRVRQELAKAAGIDQTSKTIRDVEVEIRGWLNTVVKGEARPVAETTPVVEGKAEPSPAAPASFDSHEGVLIARGKPRDRADVDDGTIYHEYRILKNPTQYHLPEEDYLIQDRIVQTEKGKVTGVRREWTTVDWAKTPEEAVKKPQGTDFGDAESLHPLHRALVEAERAETEAARVKREEETTTKQRHARYARDYEAELDKVELHGKKGTYTVPVKYKKLAGGKDTLVEETLGITGTVYDGAFGVDKRSEGKYIVTHIPTGAKLAEVSSLETARRAVKALKTFNIDWTNRDPAFVKNLPDATRKSIGHTLQYLEGERTVPSHYAEMRDAAERAKGEPTPTPAAEPIVTPPPGAEPPPTAEGGTKPPPPPSGFADTGGYAERPTPSAIEMPEIVALAQDLMAGRLPHVVRKLRGMAVGVFRAKEGVGTGKIEMEASLFTSTQQAAKTLAHEIGHLIDWLPQKTMSRGNILGHVASLRKYMLDWLSEKPGGPGPLTDADRARIRREATRLTRETAETEIDEEITHTTPITPDDILAIWNRTDFTGIPELLDYVKGLTTAEKKSIVKDALKGMIRTDLLQFARTVTEKTGRKITITRTKEATAEEIAAKYHDLIREEAAKRRLFSREEMTNELRTFTRAWKPFDPGENHAYTRYRFKPAELYADALSALITDPAYLRAKAPRFYEAFFNYLDEKPEVRDTWNRIQDRIKYGDPDGELDRKVLEGFDQREAEFAESLKRTRKDWADKDHWGTVFIDRFFSLIRHIKKVGETNIPDAVNPRHATEKWQYSGSEQNGYMLDVKSGVIDRLRDSGIGLRDFGLYLFHNRVAFGDRQDKANPYGAIASRSAKRVRRMQEQFGPALEEARVAFRKLREEWFIRKVEAAGYATPELIKAIRDTDKYATFDIVGHLDKAFGRTASSHIFKQYGTVSPTGDPFTATVMKDLLLIRNINRNSAVKSVVGFMGEHFGEDISPAERSKSGRFHDYMESRDPAKRLVVYTVDGKPRGMYLPKYIAESLSRNEIESALISDVLRYTIEPFKIMFVDMNPGFWLFNIFRDITTSLKQLPGVTPANYASHYANAILPAFRSVFGELSPVTRQMFHENTLLSVENRMGEPLDATQIDRMVRRYGLAPAKWREGLLKPFGTFWEYWANIGKGLERVPKVAAYTYLRDHFPQMSPEMRRHIVITRGGSPNFLRSGSGMPVINNLLMYSNPMKEGMRSSLESFRESPAEYVFKTGLYNLLPKFAMMGTALGLAGYQAQGILDRSSEYDNTNYTVIPLGLTPSGKGVTLRIPNDETGRLMGAVIWKVFQHEKRTLATGMFDYLSGQAPTLHPGIKTLWAMQEYMSGRNPYDSFRGTNVLSQAVFEAGGARAHKAFAEWLVNQASGGIVYRFQTDDRTAIKTELEKVTGYPFASNIVGRFIRVSDAGVRQDTQEDLRRIRALRSNETLHAYEGIQKLIGGKDVSADEALAIANKLPTLDDFTRAGLVHKYGDTYLELLMSARSNEEKLAVFNRMKSDPLVVGEEEARKWTPIKSPEESRREKERALTPAERERLRQQVSQKGSVLSTTKPKTQPSKGEPRRSILWLGADKNR